MRRWHYQLFRKLWIPVLLCLSLIIFDISTRHIYLERLLSMAWKNLSAAMVKSRMTLAILPAERDIAQANFFIERGGETTFSAADMSKLKVYFPPDAISGQALRPMTTSINRRNKTDLARTQYPPTNKYMLGDLSYDITASYDDNNEEIKQFNKPVTLTFTYTEAQIQGLDEQNLKAYYWDTATGGWVLIEDSVVDPVTKTVTVITNHFTIFTLMAPPATGGVAHEVGGGSSISGTISSISPIAGGEVNLLTTEHAVVRVEFPSGVVESSANLIARVVPISRVALSLIHPFPVNQRVLGDSAYDISAHYENGEVIKQFIKPVTLTFSYTKEQIGNLSEESGLKVYYWNERDMSWLEMENSALDVTAKRVSVATTHLTLFALLVPLKVAPVYSADLNGDGRVDLIDLGILLFNWGKPVNQKADINQTGRVDLADFAIMLYQWTG